MATELELHEYQISILRELLFKPGARFRDLKKVDVANDHFSFHLRKLIEDGLIDKREGKYYLSERGKEFANRIDTDALKFERQAKLGVALHPVRVRNGKTEYLVHQRLKEPFFGWWGSHSGKIRWGETPQQTAEREFDEETGLKGKFELKGIVHYHHVHKDGRLLEDKYFWVYKVTHTTGELKEKVEGGFNKWMTAEEYKKLPHTFADLDEVIEVIDGRELVYIDRTRLVESY